MASKNSDHGMNDELVVRQFDAGRVNDQMIPWRNPDEIELTVAQKKFLNRLVSQMGRMEEALKGAKEALAKAEESYNLAYANASEYVVVCSEEAGIVIGQEGWEFMQTQMAFVRQVGPPQVDEV